MAALSQQFPGEELLLALGGQEVRQWLGGMLVATHSGVAAGRQPAVQEVAVMNLSVSLPDHGGPPASALCLRPPLMLLVLLLKPMLSDASCRHAHRAFRA